MSSESPRIYFYFDANIDWGGEVYKEGELEDARANRESFSTVNVRPEPYDRSSVMERLAKRVSEKLQST